MKQNGYTKLHAESRPSNIIQFRLDSLFPTNWGYSFYAEPIPGMQILALGYEHLTLVFNEEVCFDSLLTRSF